MAALADRAPQPPSDPIGRISPLPALQGLAIALFLVLATLRFLLAPLDRYDEGVVLTKAMLMLTGQVPFRDYWATYGPLDTMMLALAFKVFGASVVVERLMGALTVAAFGAVAYIMLGLIRLRGAMRLLTTGLIAVVPLAVPAFNTAFLANLLGLIAVLAFLRGVEQGGIRWPAVCGAMIGLASYARPEYALAVAAGLTLGYSLLVWRAGDRVVRLQALGVFVAVGVISTAVLWLPVVNAAGIGPVRLDLVTYALQLYPRARSIPFGAGPEGLIVIAFTAAFALVWVWAAVHAFRRRQDALQLARVVALLVAAIAVFTWVRTRADGIHAFDAWPLTAVLLALLLQTRPRRPLRTVEALAGIAGILLLSAGAGGLAFRDWLLPHQQAGIARAGISGERAWMPVGELASLIRAIDDSVPPGQAIWVGLQRNDLVTFNDTMLYFLSNRPPGTVYYEALPGLTNSQAGERLITCQLTTNHVGLLVLGPNAAGEPWNLSALPGAPDLDEWIRKHQLARSSVGPYQLVRLTPGLSPDSGCPSSDAAALAPG